MHRRRYNNHGYNQHNQGFGHSGRHSSPTGGLRNGPHGNAPNAPYCKYFMNGSCNQGSNCHFRHEVQRLAEIVQCHQSVINDVVFADSVIWTAGKDACLRGWTPVPRPDGSFDLPPCGHPVQCGLPVNSVLWISELQCLAVGLSSGEVRLFMKKTGSQLDLKGQHTGPVHTLDYHAGVLISASWDGSVCFWTGEQFEKATRLPATLPPIGLVRVMKNHLWVGSVSSLTVFSLATLQQVVNIPTASLVTGLLEFGEKGVVYCTLDANVRFLNLETMTCVAEFTLESLGQAGQPGGQIPQRNGLHQRGFSQRQSNTTAVCMEGVVAANRSFALIGDSIGQITVVDLTEVNNWKCRGVFQAHAPGRPVRCITTVGDVAVTGAEDGSLAVWKFSA